MQIKTFIPFPCYNYRIYVIFTDNLEETADYLVKQRKLVNNHGVSDTTDGFTVRSPNHGYTTVVLKFDATVEQISHEAYHALCNMFKWISADHEEEVFAYSLGYVIRYIIIDQEKAKKALDKKKEV